MEEREEYVNRLQVELEEKYQDTLMMEKSKWLKEQETDIKQQVDNEVMLAKSHWDEEQTEVWVKISFQSPCLETVVLTIGRPFFLNRHNFSLPSTYVIIHFTSWDWALGTLQ